MSASTTQKKLAELQTIQEVVDSLTLSEEDRNKLQVSLGNLAAAVENNYKLTLFIQESLQNLKHDIRMLVFDRDATRRERDMYLERLVAAGLEKADSQDCE